MDVSAMQVVIGIETTVRHIVEESVSGGETLENYWTAGADGDASLHGFTNQTVKLVVSYDPPILWLDAPLSVGKTWSTTTQPYSDLDGTVPWGSPFTITFGVLSEQDLVVPAGTFHVYEIGWVPLPAHLDPPRFDILGRRLAPSSRVGGFSDWISPGVGLVRYRGAEHYDLTAYGPPLPVTPRSWAGLKGVYRR